MHNNNKTHPPFLARVSSVWFRHFRVYTKSLFSNALPPFMEPLVFLAGIGLGMASYMPKMAGMPYITFLATGLPMTAAMFTAAFECTFGTFIRMEFDKTYEGMLAAPLSVSDLFIGEILWCGTKGMFFSLAVVIIVSIFGLVPMPSSLGACAVGFLAGIMFGSLSLFVTSFVANINHFNFYFTGFLSPMFFFSGVVFPISNLPKALQPVAELFPLTHVVRLCRGVEVCSFSPVMLLDILFICVFSGVIGTWAIHRLRKKLIQ